MSAMDDLSDDELRTNVLNDPGLFLDIEDDDEDVVVSAGLPSNTVPAPQAPPPAQAQPTQSTSSSSHGNGIPKLDVTALSSVTLEPAQVPTSGFIIPGTSTSPLSFSRDVGLEQSSGAVYMVSAAHSSSQASSPQNATAAQAASSFNVYANIANPPLSARKLVFRDFLNHKSVPAHIESEESTGIFVGQLPSSYSEDDIEALLKAIGNEQGKVVQVRDVKCHNRDRTCAFIMINASALSSILDFTKRVLCDINCVWVVDHSQAAQLPLFVQQMPREQLRGVPKAALVLEKLTPQSKPRHSNHNSNMAATTPTGGYAGMQNGLMSPMQQNMVNMLSHPAFLQQQAGGNPAAAAAAAAAAAGYLDLSAMQGPSPFAGPNYAQATTMGGMPQFFGAGGFPGGAPAGALFAPGGMAPSPNSVYAMQMSNGGIANIEVANQMMIAASRSRTNSSSHHLNMLPPSPSNKDGNAGPQPKPTAVTLQPSLQSEHCSCGQMLLLSQYPEQGTCAKCQSIIMPNDVAYWCLSGHIAVCASCAIRSNKGPGGQPASPWRLASDASGQRVDAPGRSRTVSH